MDTTPHRTPACSAVLLVGGTSRRMGRPKALLSVGGRPLWQVQLEKLEAVAGEVFLAPGRSGLAFSTDRPCLTDASGVAGPLAGILAGLRAARHPRLLVLAVDLPELTVDFLRQLLDRATPTVGIVPFLDGYYQGTAAVYTPAVRPVAEALAARGDYSLQSLARDGLACEALAEWAVSPAERKLFTNWNAPADLPS